MIEITLRKKDKSLKLNSRGHSELAPTGQDILCAGVSAGLQMIEVGINGVLDLKKKIEKKKGFFETPWIQDEKAEILIISFFRTAQVLQKSYPNRINTSLIIEND